MEVLEMSNVTIIHFPFRNCYMIC
uniref:Uncharacterized protein n=1 Tax=Arundo donax TaxID=35708 RepID=A0A0A8ZIF1_ARUDO